MYLVVFHHWLYVCEVLLRCSLYYQAGIRDNSQQLRSPAVSDTVSGYHREIERRVLRRSLPVSSSNRMLPLI